MYYVIVFLACLESVLLAASAPSIQVWVRAEPDYSLVLSLTEDIPIAVEIVSQHRSGCSCCQHGSPHTHLTVSQVKNTPQHCIVPQLRRWTDPHQAARMVKQWVHLLAQAFPQHQEKLTVNCTKLLDALTHLQTKWHDVLRNQDHTKVSHIRVPPTAGGYIGAIEAWCAESQKVADAHAQRTVSHESTARA